MLEAPSINEKLVVDQSLLFWLITKEEIEQLNTFYPASIISKESFLIDNVWNNFYKKLIDSTQPPEAVHFRSTQLWSVLKVHISKKVYIEEIFIVNYLNVLNEKPYENKMQCIIRLENILWKIKQLLLNNGLELAKLNELTTNKSKLLERFHKSSLEKFIGTDLAADIKTKKEFGLILMNYVAESFSLMNQEDYNDLLYTLYLKMLYDFSQSAECPKDVSLEETEKRKKILSKRYIA